MPDVEQSHHSWLVFHFKVVDADFRYGRNDVRYFGLHQWVKVPDVEEIPDRYSSFSVRPVSHCGKFFREYLPDVVRLKRQWSSSKYAFQGKFFRFVKIRGKSYFQKDGFLPSRDYGKVFEFETDEFGLVVFNQRLHSSPGPGGFLNGFFFHSQPRKPA